MIKAALLEGLILLAPAGTLSAATIEGSGHLGGFDLVTRDYQGDTTLMCNAPYADARTLQISCEPPQGAAGGGARIFGRGPLGGWKVVYGEMVICNVPEVDGYKVICNQGEREPAR